MSDLLNDTGLPPNDCQQLDMLGNGTFNSWDLLALIEIIMNGGTYSSLKKVYREDKENLHAYTINRIENGLNLNASDYVDSIESVKKMKFDLNAIFKNFDAIITPAAPGEAPRDLSTTGNAMFNGYWTMMGVPAISLPLLKGKNSLPIGVQVITSWKKDNLLLKISDAILKDYQ